MHLPSDLAAAHQLILTLQEKTKRLEALALTDGLTGVSNRRAFDDRLAAAFAHARRTLTPLSVVVVDLDNFKLRNDTLGHAVGDVCLRAVAGQLVAHTRGADVVARIGGEEFALVLPNTTEDDAAQLVARIAQRLRYGCCAGEPMTFSAGVAALDGTMFHPSTIVDYADRAMYQVKHSGKDGISIHRPHFNRAADPNLFRRITRYLAL